MSEQPAGGRQPDLDSMLQLGALARRVYAAYPTDLNEVIHAVEGGCKLLAFVTERLAALDSDKVDRDTVNLLAHAIKAMTQAHQQLVLTYALSGAATEDLMAQVRQSMRKETF